jgi:predicted lipoprotein with Yx(FWY)xxD motif
MNKAPFLLAACLVAAATAVGCGSSSDNASTGNKSAAQAMTAPAAAASGPAVVTTKAANGIGTVLAAADGRTLYLFLADKGKKSTCSGACAAAWPPLTTKGAPTVKGAAKSAAISTTKRADGKKQVTYNGHPLYYYAADKDAGDAYGQGLDQYGAEWYVLSPTGNRLEGGQSKTQSGNQGKGGGY